MSEQRPEATLLEHDFPISYSIFAMSRVHRAIAAGKLAELGLFPNQEIMIMRLGEEDGLPQKTLTRMLGISHVSVAKTVARMERGGLVERRSSESDGRVSLVFLTEAGRSLRQRIIGVWAELEELTAGALTAAQQAQFQQAAGQLRAALEACINPAPGEPARRNAMP